jgi:hypothetical protein
MPRWWCIPHLISCLISTAGLVPNDLDERIGLDHLMRSIIDDAVAREAASAVNTPKDADNNQSDTGTLNLAAVESEQKSVAVSSNSAFPLPYFLIHAPYNYCPFLSSFRLSLLPTRTPKVQHRVFVATSTTCLPLCLSFTFTSSISFADFPRPPPPNSHPQHSRPQTPTVLPGTLTT